MNFIDIDEGVKVYTKSPLGVGSCKQVSSRIQIN